MSVPGRAARRLTTASVAGLVILLLLPASVLACHFTGTVMQVNGGPSSATLVTIDVGGQVRDTSTIDAARSGTVTYYVYSNYSSCTSRSSSNRVEVSSHSASGSSASMPASNWYTFNSAGDFWWQAKFVYSGGTIWSGCGEKTVVRKGAPSISTLLSGSGGQGPAAHISVAPGTQVTETVNVGNLVNPSSAAYVLSIRVFAEGQCPDGAYLQQWRYRLDEITVDPAAKTATKSVTWTPPGIGVYSFRAIYLGDANNNEAKSACGDETVTVEQYSPTMSTSLAGDGQSGASITVPIGTSVTDQATLTGASADAGGTVAYKVYSDDACATLLQGAGTKTVANGTVPASDPVTFTSAGTWYWEAVYSGDAKNVGATSPCTAEVVTVPKARPSIDTLLSAPGVAPTKQISVLPGTTVTDTATLTNAHQPTGSVTFTVYGGGACEGDPIATLDGAISSSSASVQRMFSDVGTFSWRAYYPGDANNEPATSACDEFVYVNRSVPTIRTVPSATHVPVDAWISDTAYVEGGDNPTGSVSFYLYPPSDPTCAASPVFQQTSPLVNGVATTNPVQLTAVGTYHWSAIYGGDENNAAVAHLCGEPVDPYGPDPTPTPTPVPTPTPTPELTPSPTPTPDLTPSPEPSGSVAPATEEPSGSAMPDTSVTSPSGGTRTGVLPIFLLFLALSTAGLIALSPAPRRIRR